MFCGVGTIVSTFEISGEIGVRVAYSIDRLTINIEDQMSAISGYVSQVSGDLINGNSYIDWASLSDDFVATYPTVRGGSFQGMIFSPDMSGDYSSIGVTGTRSFKLVEKKIFDGTVDYYPNNASVVSGLISISQLRVI